MSNKTFIRILNISVACIILGIIALITLNVVEAMNQVDAAMAICNADPKAYECIYSR